jgi:enoyl-CoA hydratase
MLRIGLIERMVAPGDVHAALADLANTIAENGPLATRGIKRIARTRQAAGFRAARDLSDEMRAALEWTQDVDEGIAAVREGRKPRFVGR